MKTVSAALLNLWATQNHYAMADLLTLTPQGAAPQRLTSADADETFGGCTWRAQNPLFKHGGTRP